MPDLLNAIDQLYRKGQFTELPRGPLGKYIEVADEKWKASIESVLGARISAFVVNDAKDREVLSRLISTKFREAKMCSIITTKFTNQMYNVRSGKVRAPSNTHCLLDIIKCNDAVVINTLIDFCQIERILLTEDQQTAFNITSEEENVPVNLLKVILVNPATEMYPAPSVRTYAMLKRPARYLQVNMKERKE